MAQTYTQIRQATIRQTGLLFVTGTSDTGGSTTFMRDAALTRHGDKRLVGHHILLTSGAPAFNELFITNSFQDEGDVEFRPEEASAPDALTYEILPFSGMDILRSVQDSVLQLYDIGLLQRDFWMRMVGGSPIYNADWSYWTGANAVDGWTANVTTLTRERASGNLALGETALALTAAAGYASLDAQYQRYLEDFKGDTVTLHCWVKTSTANNARLAHYDGSTIHYSAYHGGDGDWELLHVEVTTTTGDTVFQPRLYADTNTTAYFGMPFYTGGHIRIRSYPFPHRVMPDGPYEISLSTMSVEEDEIATGRGLGAVRQPGPSRLVLDSRVVKHHDENASTQVAVLDFSLSGRPPGDLQLLWLRGDGPLTVPTSVISTDSLEVTESEGLMLATAAAINLLERAGAGAPSATRRTFGQRLSELRGQFSSLISGAGEERSVAHYGLNW